MLKVRQELGRLLVEAVVAMQESVQVVPVPLCPRCGKEMQVKGEKEKGVMTRLGWVKIARHYYYCSHCQQGSFPLDEQLQVLGRSMSEALTKLVVWVDAR